MKTSLQALGSMLSGRGQTTAAGLILDLKIAMEGLLVYFSRLMQQQVFVIQNTMWPHIMCTVSLFLLAANVLGYLH